MPETARRDRSVRRVILVEGAANCVVLALKTWVGLSTGSYAILSDALHSLTDLFNNIVAWIVVRISEKPPDRKHPYGHRKFEGLAVFILATLLAVLAFELATRALSRESSEPAVDPIGFALMLVVLAVNVTISLWQRSWAIRLKSDILLADASHTFSDVLVTSVVILGWQLSARGLPWLDTVCALAVSAFVLYLAYTLFRRVAPVLLDEIAIEPEKLISVIEAIPGVGEVRRVRTRWIGPECLADVVVTVKNTLSIEESHDIADHIEAELEANFGIEDVTIHVEPHAAADTQAPVGPDRRSGSAE